MEPNLFKTMDSPEASFGLTPFSLQCPTPTMELEEKQCFIVRVKPSQSNVHGEQDALIHKEEAVCRLCFKILGETDTVLKTRCECQFTLIHETCANQWCATECGSCHQIIQTIPVTISNPHPNEHHEPVPPRNIKRGCCSIL